MLAALGEVAANDWREFFRARVYERNPRAPLGGIEGAGWKLTYTNTIPDWVKLQESKSKTTDFRFSLGLLLTEDGRIEDVIPGSAADKAGMSPAMKLVAVNGRHWAPELLRTAIKSATKGTEPIELLVENDEFFKSSKLDYHDGEKYPQLERESGQPDLLTEILKPLTPEPQR